ncbi:MAG: class I SAM-dependent methyltransferase [Myxococcota bacterium]|nr:class I SAM-dependent methyltransferase [Myxococcota bacterium]
MLVSPAIEESLVNRLRKNLRRLQPWAKREGISCYRIYDAEIPELPLLIDRYEDALLLSAREGRGFLREHPAPEEAARHCALRAAELLHIPPGQVYLTFRRRLPGGLQKWAADETQAAPSQQVGGTGQAPNQQEVGGTGQAPNQQEVGRTGQAPNQQEGVGAQRASTQAATELKSTQHLVREGGLRFLVELGTLLDTGLFLDHRRSRKLLAERSANKDVLNLFSYTASFSVYAAAAGAKSTTSVDLSPRYSAWALQNFAINDIPASDKGLRQPSEQGPSHVVHQDDVLAFVERAILRGARYDLIIVDPPTFSNSKRTPTVFDVQRDHTKLLLRLRELLRPEGSIFFSTNKRGFTLSETLSRAFGVESWTERSSAFDFPSKPHRSWMLSSVAQR